MDKRYFETVQLLLYVALLIFRGEDFAMKGGTAINLFHRDMPRLSVDIDVVYIHGDRPREEALGAISQALDRAATELERRGLAVRRQASTGTGDIKLFVRRGLSEVKVEVNPLGRGRCYPRAQPNSAHRRRTNSSVPSGCRSWRLRNSIAANLSPRWTASTRATGSIACCCGGTKG